MPLASFKRLLLTPRLFLPPFAFFLLFLALAANAENIKDIHPTSYVTDLAHILSPDSKARLENLCLELEQKTGAQMAIFSGVFMVFTTIGYCGAHHHKSYLLIVYGSIMFIFTAGNIVVWVIYNDTSFLGSMGLRSIVIPAKAVSRRGGKVALFGPIPMVEEVLKASNIDEIIPIFHDLDSAVAALC